jgi:2',3'-cyclic-nucleotide 2'-phosphodiesterase (5'-nucleotidase family)
MKYDAIVLGEHDFDYGKKAILEFRKKYSTPWVSANLVVRNNSQNFVRPYILKYAGVRVGFIGFSNPDTPSLTSRDNVAGLVFNPPGASAKGLHSILRKDADLFITLSRLGIEGDEKFAKDNLFLNVIVGGHSRTVLNNPVVFKKPDGSLGPIVVQAGSQGLYLGRLDLTIEGHRNPKTKKEEYAVTDYQYQLIPITSDLPEDVQMVALLDKFKEKLKAEPLDEVLATFTGTPVLSNQGDSLLGEITTDAMLKSSQADAAFINSGFFQGDFATGALNRETLYEICPADEEVITLRLPGSALRKILELSSRVKGSSGFLQVSGIKLKPQNGGLDIQVGLDPLEDHKIYTVAINGFLSGGGGGYELFRKYIKTRVKTGVMIRDLLESSLKTSPKLSSAELEKRWN